MKRKFGSLFGGCGGFDLGAKNAGCDLAWSIEFESDIAAISNQNLGKHVVCKDILDCNPLEFEPVDILQASPPCPNFSVAKIGGEETSLDIALADKVCDFISATNPNVFILENVYGYRKSESFKRILAWLESNAYSFTFFHCNFADFGVPQTRKRLILIARKDDRQALRPSPTHAKIESMLHAPWVGWYEATKHFHADCQDSHFADWQIDLMMKDPKFESVLMQTNKFTSSQPRTLAQPSFTVTVSNNQNRAFLLNGTPNQYQTSLTSSFEKEPSIKITATQEKRPLRAWLEENGRIIKLNINCLAALQSFPDWWKWPDKVSVSGKAIGNAVSPLAAQRIIEST